MTRACKTDVIRLGICEAVVVESLLAELLGGSLQRRANVRRVQRGDLTGVKDGTTGVVNGA